MNNTTVSPQADDGWSSMFSYSAYVIEGLVIGFSNFIIAVAVLRYSALRKTKEYLMVMGLSIADGLHMIALFGTGLYRVILVFSGEHSKLRTPWYCATMPQLVLRSFSNSASSLMLLVISIDRLLAMSTPLKYITWTRKYAWGMLGVTYIYSLISGSMMYLVVVYSAIDEVADKGILISAKCLGSAPLNVLETPLSKLYVTYYMYSPTAIMFASIVLYGPVWLIYKKHLAQVGSDNSESQKRKLAQQRRVTITLGFSCLCSLFLAMIPNMIVRMTMGKVPDYLRLIVSAFANLNSFCNIFIYSLRHHEMKEGIKALFTGKQMPDDLATWKQNMNAKKKKLQKQKTIPNNVSMYPPDA